MSTQINLSKRIAIKNECVTLTPNVNSINFEGTGINATTSGDDVTVTVPGSYGSTIFYLNESVPQAPYKEFSAVITTAVEQIVPFTVAGGVTTTIASYQTPSGVPGTTLIPGGFWQFYLHFNATTAGQNWIIRPYVYKRDLGGIETLILTSDPFIVTNMGTTTTQYTSDAVLSSTSLLVTDRLVVKIDMQNTTGVSQTANFRTEGSTHYSVVANTLNQNTAIPAPGIIVLGSGTCSTMRCGVSNTATGACSAALSGSFNLSATGGTFIAGGQCNIAGGCRSAITAGFKNLNTAVDGFIGGGNCNNTCNFTNGCLALGAVVVGGVGNNTTGGTWSLATCTFTVAPTICNAGQYSFVGGGFQNIASGDRSVVSGGHVNTSSALYSTVGGGNVNTNAGTSATISGGEGGSITSGGSKSIIGGGRSNSISGSYSFIGGAFSNIVSAQSAAAVAGRSNTASANCAFIGGGTLNTANGNLASVLGGFTNLASGSFSTVSGGYCNCATQNTSNVSGGYCNLASATRASVGGGVLNTASSLYAKVSGGAVNRAQGIASFIGGGTCNNVCNSTSGCLSFGAVVVGGVGNNTTGGTFDIASCCFSVAPTICNAGQFSFVGGGFQNLATSTRASISGGFKNRIANATDSFIGGGICNNICNPLGQQFSYGSVVVGGVGNNTTGGVFSTSSCCFTSAPTITNGVGQYSFIGGGFQNNTSGQNSVIGGGIVNIACATATGILGGCSNNAVCNCSFIVGSQITSDRVCATFVNNLSIMNIPTSSAGLPSGAVWRNGNVLNIV